MRDFIAYIMKRNGLLNLNQLAKRLGVSHATLSRWLDGSDRPGVPNCMKLAKLSGCPLDYVISLAYVKEVER